MRLFRRNLVFGVEPKKNTTITIGQSNAWGKIAPLYMSVSEQIVLQDQVELLDPHFQFLFFALSSFNSGFTGCCSDELCAKKITRLELRVKSQR